MISTAGIITTIAGNGISGYSGDGGPATSAQLSTPIGVASDSFGNLFVADFYNLRVRKISTGGIITTIAGNGSGGYSGDGGAATSAQVNPFDVAADGNGNVYIADFYKACIRKVSAAGVISTIAGNGTISYSGDGGPVTSAQIYNPFGVGVDTAGNLFFSDSGNSRIRKVAPSGTITTIAGNGTNGYSGDGGHAVKAALESPGDIALDGVGSVYFVDSQRIRKVSATGVITTVAGTGIQGFSGDGGPAINAMLNNPGGIALDNTGNLYMRLPGSP